MDSDASSNFSFRFGDHVCHPRLGQAIVLRQQHDGRVVVRFDDKSHNDVIFPFQLEPLEGTNCPSEKLAILGI